MDRDWKKQAKWKQIRTNNLTVRCHVCVITVKHLVTWPLCEVKKCIHMSFSAMVPLTFDYCVFDVSSFYYHSARSSGKNSRNVENRTTDCRKQDTGFNGNSGQKKTKTHSETTQKRKIILNLLSTCTFHLPTVRHWACVRKQKTKKQNSGC